MRTVTPQGNRIDNFLGLLQQSKDNITSKRLHIQNLRNQSYNTLMIIKVTSRMF